VALAERAHTAFQTPPVAADPESGPVGTVGLESQSTPVEDIAIQVRSLELQETGGPAHSASLEVNDIDNPAPGCRAFLDQLFPATPSPTLESPVRRWGKGLGRSVSVEPFRKSDRQAAKRSMVPVSQCATACLIREFELVGTRGKIGDEALRKYSAMFQGALEPKTIATGSHQTPG
jgi:hypothetical protein